MISYEQEEEIPTPGKAWSSDGSSRGNPSAWTAAAVKAVINIMV
jgi:hypothetical protein